METTSRGIRLLTCAALLAGALALPASAPAATYPMSHHTAMKHHHKRKHHHAMGHHMAG